MSDLEFLYVLLAAFYLWECACWVPRGGVAFVRWWGRHSLIAPLLGNQQGGFAFAQPLPPLGRIFVATQLPVSASPEGILAYVATVVSPGGRPPQTCRFLRWEDLKSIKPHRKLLLVNGALFVRTQSSTHARWLADELTRLARLPVLDRPDAVARFIQSAFDPLRLRRRLEDLRSRDRPIRWLANLTLIALFIAAPSVIWRFGIVDSWLYLLLGVFTLSATTAILFLRAHRALHPKAGDERFSQFLMILLFPPAAVRAGDMLSRPLLEEFHPLTVAAVICRAQALKKLARRLLPDLKNPALPLATAHEPNLAAVESWSRTAVLASASGMLAELGLDPGEAIAPPVPLDATCRAYCPRCQAQFTKVEAACGDCGGLPVVAFGEQAAP